MSATITQQETTALWGLVLAGGDGQRLQELTRALTGRPIPKQYCRLLYGRSLLEATLDRVHGLIDPARTAVIVNRDHLRLARPQLHTVPAHNILVQARNCDTGPGLLYALMQLERRAGDVAVAVFPSDHFIDDGQVFNAHVADAERLLARRPDKIVLLGIPSRGPDAGFGYIELGARLAGFPNGFCVDRFREKPSPAAARELHAAGSLWNSFVMVFRLRRMLELIRRAVPADYARMAAVRDGAPAAAVYRTLRSWNFSQAVLAPQAAELLVIRVDGVYWNDWGTPQAIRDTLRSLRQPDTYSKLGRDLAARAPRPLLLPVAATVAALDDGAA